MSVNRLYNVELASQLDHVMIKIDISNVFSVKIDKVTCVYERQDRYV